MEEHRERVSTATNAVTLGDLQALVSDLQSESAPAQVPTLKSRTKLNALGVLAAAFVVSVLLGVGIGWGLYANTSSPLDFTTDPGARPDGIAPVVLTPPRQLHSLGGLTGLMEQTRKRFGDTMGFRLVIYRDYVVTNRAPTPSCVVANISRRYDDARRRTDVANQAKEVIRCWSSPFWVSLSNLQCMATSCANG